MTIAVQGAVGENNSKATTRLSYKFNSLAVINGVPFGANSSGLFQLNTGETDNDSVYTRTFTLATTDFGDDHPKHLRYIYMTVDTDNDFKLSIKTDNGLDRILEASLLMTGLQRIRIENIYADVGEHWSITMYSNHFFRVDKISAIFYRTSYGNIGCEKVI